jgi:predicted RNA methylase
MTTDIKENVQDVLGRGELKGNLYFLPNEQLDRKVYVDVNKVLVALGGKWNRKEKAHVFIHPVEEIFDEVLTSGSYVDKKKELQFFETPSELADELMVLADIQPDDRVLEPSAGSGALVEKMWGRANPISVVAVEIDPDHIFNLGTGAIGFDLQVIHGDFLEWSADYNSDRGNQQFDKIVMNPPFTKGQDIKHIMAAYDLLKIGGRLVSICSESAFQNDYERNKEFANFLKLNHAAISRVESGAFKESGTLVPTRIIVINK